MSSEDPTIDQRRAAHALTQIRRMQTTEETIQGHYRSYVQALPAEIISNGLGQALATHLAAGDGAHRYLYEHVGNWLCSEEPYAPYRAQAVVIDAICSGNVASYRQAHAEAMAYLVWLKKFAVAFLKPLKPSAMEVDG